MKRELTEQERAFVREVTAFCEAHYEEGGDLIVECYEDSEILEEFKTLDEVKAFCKLHVENGLNTRWGEDTDPEMTRYEKSQEW